MTHQTVTSEPTTAAPSSGLITLVLKQLDCARLHALRAANEIATTATALSAGLISVEAAILHLHQFGLVEVSS